MVTTHFTDTGLLQNLSSNEATLKLGTMQAAEIDAKIDEIKQALVNLTHSTTKHLIIHGDALTEEQARLILNYLREDELALFTVEITLPAHLEQNKIQIEFDNLISNHVLEKNKQQITGSLPPSEHLDPQVIKETPKGRILPKRIRPKIEITLYEESTNESPKKETPVIKSTTPPSTLVEPPQLERSPMAAQIINELLSQDIFQAEKSVWEQISKRNEAQTFRKNFARHKTTQIKDHPIQYLIGTNQGLQDKLNQWTKTLKLEVEQLDALLDILGQYDTAGLVRLFQLWEYDNDPYKTAAFLEDTYTAAETHTKLLAFPSGSSI